MKKIVLFSGILLITTAIGCISGGRIPERGYGEVRGAYQQVLADEPGNDPMRESVYFIPFKRYTF